MPLEMQKTIQFERVRPGTSLNDFYMTYNLNMARLEAHLQRMFSEIRTKEWVYFTRRKKKWRLGPVGDHLEAQYFTGTNIHDKSQWINDDNWQMEWRSWGGADA